MNGFFVESLQNNEHGLLLRDERGSSIVDRVAAYHDTNNLFESFRREAKPLDINIRRNGGFVYTCKVWSFSCELIFSVGNPCHKILMFHYWEVYVDMRAFGCFPMCDCCVRNIIVKTEWLLSIIT